MSDIARKAWAKIETEFITCRDWDEPSKERAFDIIQAAIEEATKELVEQNNIYVHALASAKKENDGLKAQSSDTTRLDSKRCPICGEFYLQSDGKCPKDHARESSSGNASTPTKGAFTSRASGDIARKAAEWAADDRKWNTQEVVEKNLIAFAQAAIAALLFTSLAAAALIWWAAVCWRGR